MAIDPVCNMKVDGFYDIHDVCLSIPLLVNKNGVAKTVKIHLEDIEAEQLRSSADYLKSILQKLDIAKVDARL